MKTPNEMIDLLGGTVKAAQKLGVSPQVVTNWKARGKIPYGYAMAIVRASGRKIKYTDFFDEEAA